MSDFDNYDKYAQAIIRNSKNRNVPNLERYDQLTPDEQEQLVPSDPDQIAIETPDGFVPLGELVKRKERAKDQKPPRKGFRFHIHRD